jgi:hypothetical protein
MWACRATLRGKAGPSTPPSGKHRFKARAWCAGSTSTATGKEISPGTAASTGPFWFIKWTPIASGKANCHQMTVMRDRLRPPDQIALNFAASLLCEERTLADAQILDSAQDRGGAREVFDQYALGDLDFEAGTSRSPD